MIMLGHVRTIPWNPGFNRLNRLTMQSRPIFFEMIELLKNEEATSEVSITQLRSGALPRPKKKKTAKIDKRLKRKFKKGKISVEVEIINYIWKYYTL